MSGNRFRRKLGFFCHQNVIHEMLYKSPRCLVILKNGRKFYSVSRWRIGWYSRSQFCMPSMSVNTLCICHFCTKLSLCISYILYKTKALKNRMNRKREQSEISLHSNYWKTTIIILVGFDWNLGSFPSIIWYWYLFAWHSNGLMKGEIFAFIEKSCHIYFVSMGAIVVGLCHDIFCKVWWWWLGCILQQKLCFLFFNRSFPLCQAHHFLLFSHPRLLMICCIVLYGALIKLPLNYRQHHTSACWD